MIAWDIVAPPAIGQMLLLTITLVCARQSDQGGVGDRRQDSNSLSAARPSSMTAAADRL